MHNKPSVGDTLYYSKDDICSPGVKSSQIDLSPVVVIKVGRKYLTAILVGVPLEYTWMHMEFEVSSFRQNTDHGNAGRLYSSVQDFKDEIETLKLFDDIADMFAQHMRNKIVKLKTISLADLRTINALACGKSTP